MSINGYIIERMAEGSGWGVLKVGETRGLIFRTKRAAVKYAEGH